MLPRCCSSWHLPQPESAWRPDLRDPPSLLRRARSEATRSVKAGPKLRHSFGAMQKTNRGFCIRGVKYLRLLLEFEIVDRSSYEAMLQQLLVASLSSDPYQSLPGSLYR
jgi:hypothetical protein